MSSIVNLLRLWVCLNPIKGGSVNWQTKMIVAVYMSTLIVSRYVGSQHFQKLATHWVSNEILQSEISKPTPIHYKKACSCYEVGEGGEKRHVETEPFIHFLHSLTFETKKPNKIRKIKYILNRYKSILAQCCTYSHDELHFLYRLLQIYFLPLNY